MRELQAVIGREAREQLLEAEGRLPEVALACVGGGSNAIGLFAGFVDDAEVRLVGVEAGGAASLGSGRPAVLHGSRSSVLADEDGQVLDAESISAGLDYPGVGPEHAFLRDSGRAEYVGTSDEEALAAFRRLARTEGILPALEPAHALARVAELDEELVLLCLSGRGDKDLAEVTASVSGSLGWDPQRAPSFFDDYGEQEWTRFEDGRTPAPSLDVHLDRLRRFVGAGDRVLEVGAGPGRFTIELARLGAEVSRLRPLAAPARAQPRTRRGGGPRGARRRAQCRPTCSTLGRWEDGASTPRSASAARSATWSTGPRRASPSSSA